MKIKQNRGFTLIEVLVGINISFIVITLVVSFYLLSSKFISAFSSGAIEKHEVNNSLNIVFQQLERSEDFVLKCSGNMCLFLLDNRDSLIISEQKISVKGLYKIEKIKEIALKIYLVSGDSLEFKPKDSSPLNPELNVISSQEISKISLLINNNKDNFVVEIALRNVADRRFINAGENDK